MERPGSGTATGRILDEQKPICTTRFRGFHGRGLRGVPLNTLPASLLASLIAAFTKHPSIQLPAFYTRLAAAGLKIAGELTLVMVAGLAIEGWYW